MPGNALREVFARFGVDFDNAPLDQGAASTENVTSRLQALGGVLAGGALALGIRSFVQDIAGVGDELDKTSQALGLSTASLQAWRAAAQHAGVAPEQLSASFEALYRAVQTATEGGATQSAVFRDLGVDLQDADGGLRSLEDLLPDIADGIAGMEGHTERAGASMRLFGRAGARLLPLLSQGSGGVREAAEAFRELGGGMSEEAIAAAAEYTDRMQDVDDALLGIKSRIAVLVLPAISRMADGMAHAEARVSRLFDRGRLLETGMGLIAAAAIAAGSSTAAAWVAAAAPFVALGALLLGLVLIVEDLAIGFEGGRSALADLGVEIEETIASAADDLGGLVYLWEYLAGVIDSATRAVLFFGTQVGLVDPEGTLGRFATEGVEDQIAQRTETPEQRRQALAAYRASSIGQGGALSFLVPDRAAAAYFADQAVRAPTPTVAGSAGGGGTVFRPEVRIQVDAAGMTPAQAEPMVRRAVSRALSAQADDLADTLAGQGA